ncbi:MAG: thiamine-phosphate pyrophosphorylase [Sulfurovum sp.]|nr:thiamine-phosphate pyrophosphorylase [Sulfurovum sp.]
MTNSESPERVARLIDANLNRLKEGIRVIEDINRYLYDDASLTSQLKSLRHRLQTLYSQERLYFRDIENDVQKKSIESELIRRSIKDLLIANFSRAQESARVLEEGFKLIDPALSEIAKEARYSLYGIEKDFFIKHLAKES